MATTPRQRNGRPIGIWETQAERDNGGSITISATTYSKPIYGPQRHGQASLMLIWGAGWTGAFELQYTLKPNPELTTDADWVTDSAAEVVGDSLTVSGSAGKAVVFVGNVLPEWFRIKATHTSGSAAVQGYARVDGDR